MHAVVNDVLFYNSILIIFQICYNVTKKWLRLSAKVNLMCQQGVSIVGSKGPHNV